MSKILKQNGSSGKIMRAQTSGKVLKQNYNFGRAWSSYNPSNAYIDIPKNIPIGASFTIGFFEKIINRTNVGATAYLKSSDDYLKFSFYVNVAGLRYLRYKDIVYSNYNNFLSSASFNGNNFEYYGTNDIVVTGQTSLASAIPSILLSPTGLNNKTLINGLFIYNRPLSKAEYDYRINNGLGNDLLNYEGLWAYYELSGAEILNISGNDVIGVRDLINNNHATIMNLPAGTLQEQLEYANANLFELW